MKIVICAATDLELKIIQKSNFNSNHSIKMLSHGVGILHATYSLTTWCQEVPDLIIQCGIAGSYNTSLILGETVFVHTDQLGDCGAEDHQHLINYTDFSFVDEDKFPFNQGKIMNPTEYQLDIQQVEAITVNLCAGCEETIAYRKSKFNAAIETMEGAALHYVCQQHNIQFMQLRGISNYIEPRNLNNWKIDQAIQNYSKFIIDFINSLPYQ